MVVVVVWVEDGVTHVVCFVLNAGAKQLTEAAEKEGKDFADFTFQGTNILDGKRYSLSAADLEAELDFGPDDM